MANNRPHAHHLLDSSIIPQKKEAFEALLRSSLWCICKTIIIMIRTTDRQCRKSMQQHYKKSFVPDVVVTHNICNNDNNLFRSIIKIPVVIFVLTCCIQLPLVADAFHVRIPQSNIPLPLPSISSRTGSKLHGWFTTKDESSVQKRSTKRRQQKQLKKQQQQQRGIQSYEIQEIGECIGSGSYGTVHYIYVNVDNNDDDEEIQEEEEEYDDDDDIADGEVVDDLADITSTSTDTTTDSRTTSTTPTTTAEKSRTKVLIGKRPWTIQELQTKYVQDADDVVNKDDIKHLKDKAIRCLYYYNVEKHCFHKMTTTTTTTSLSKTTLSSLYQRTSSSEDTDTDNDNDNSMDEMLFQGIPQYRGTGVDYEQREWLLFDPLYAPPPKVMMVDTNNDNNDNDDSNSINGNTNQKLLQIENDDALYETDDSIISTRSNTIQQERSLTIDDINNSNNINNEINTNEIDMIAFSLQEIMEVDRINSEQQEQIKEVNNGIDIINRNTPVPPAIKINHHLYCTSQAILGSNREHTLVATLDVILEQLLQILVHVHSYSIVHRDVKPANILITKPISSSSSSNTDSNNQEETEISQLVLIDFGSAGDLSTAGLLKENVGLDINRVAISPIYAAPEIFLDNVSNNKYATNFDCFSVALLYCQLLFQYLDERTESGFHQQLANQNVPWDLDGWLQNAIQSKVRPVGLTDALQVLSERPGLWKLLQDMLHPDPSERLSSIDALRRWNKIRNYAFISDSEKVSIKENADSIDPDLYDGAYLLDVLESLETCEIPTIRPLHFVTSFDRSTSLGLYLAEADGVDINSMDETVQEQWQRATADAGTGEVFVQDIIPGGQADKMGIFAIGDRLQGVGELPLAGGGFVRATELIQDQPKSAEFITLQFDRKSVLVTDIPSTTDKSKDASTTTDLPTIQKVDQGAWSMKGRRQAQEDTFILHEVLDTKDRSVILAGVFDGHLGSAASEFCRDDLPVAFAAAMNVGGSADDDENSSSENESSDMATTPKIQSFLELAWNECCESYRSYCKISDVECVAEYDPREGILQANTGSQTAVAGTTAMVFAFDQHTNQLAALNCGDCRGIVINANGELIFQTIDHTPESEIERLTEMGNMPQCDIARWTITVNNYDYAVSRSLGGYLATSKGIISDADITSLPAQPGMTILTATDGLWDTIDTLEVIQVITKLRKLKSNASDIAKALCSLAYEKGSSDNISVVALCLE